MKQFWSWIRDDGGGRVLRLEGPIDEESLWSDGVTPKAFRDDLYAEDGDVTIFIRSPGGNVFAAAEIYTMIRDYPGKVTVKIDAIAASAATVVAVAGDRVLISPVAMLMVHDPATIAMGTAKAMEKAITTLNEVKESIINAYVAKTGLSRNKVAKLMENETWMNAKKAVELGFADEIMFDDKHPEPDTDQDERENGDTDGDDEPEEEKDGRIHLDARPLAEALEGVLYSTRLMGQAILNRIGSIESESGEQIENEGPPDAEENRSVEDEGNPPETQPEGEEAPVAEDSASPEESVAPPDGIDCEADTAAETIEDDTTPEEHKNILPDGFFAINQEGRTRDGSMPFIILKNQLDRMR